MTRAEVELHSIRTTIEAYKMILKNNSDLSKEDKNNIRKKITELGDIWDKILSEIYNYGFKINLKTIWIYLTTLPIWNISAYLPKWTK